VAGTDNHRQDGHGIPVSHILDGTARLGLRQDGHVLIHEGALFSNPLPTPMADDAHWLRLPQANFRHVDMSFPEGGYDAIRPHLH